MHLLLTMSVALTTVIGQVADMKLTEWKGAVEAIDVRAETFAMLVVGKDVPENGKVMPLKLTAVTRYVWRTEDPKKFLAARPDDVKRGQHIHVLKNDQGEVIELRLPAKK
ncbi:MAG: hypothetical protein JNM56_09515 [Planctomycetia bacterium]|nr:hypothetical protein [Planctomycetia bacterium]